jgi:hypothetical protein
VTTAPAVDLLGAAMVDFAAGRRSPVWLRVGSGRRLTHDLAAYFAPVTAQERALLALVEGPVLDVGCGPARHARLLQARGLTAIGLDRSLLALGLARSFGLRHRVHADACSGPLPPAGMSTGIGSVRGGGGCRPVSRPSSTWPTRPAGVSGTPPPWVRTTGPPCPSTPVTRSAGPRRCRNDLGTVGS